jgi:MoaA/NifB/PqqE/SkfB family radical SAM enzyme
METVLSTDRKDKGINISESFCILPWIHMATYTDGRALLCCVAKASDQKLIEKNVSEIWNSDEWKRARRHLLEGKKIPQCSYCWKEEAAGIRSHRFNQNYIWYKELGEEYIRDLISKTEPNGRLTEDLITFDFRLGNTCNLQCVMCRPKDSSRWLGDAKKLARMLETDAKYDWESKIKLNHDYFEWYKKDRIWKDFSYLFPNIRELVFGGGEPLLIKEHYTLIRDLVDGGFAKDISIRYHTNGTILTDEILEFWKEFKNVDLMISVDMWGKKNEWVRYRSHWSDVIDNLRILDDTGDNINPRLSACVHALNIYDIPDMAENCLNAGFKKVGNIYDKLFHVQTVQYPEYMSSQVLPLEVKSKVKEHWESFSHLKEINQWKTNIERQIDFMMSEDHSHLMPQLLEYKSKLDQLHGTNYSEYFPEFSELLDG